MPRPLRPCADIHCTTLTRTTRCPTHTRTRHRDLDQRRGTTTERGYGWQHQQAAQRQITEQPWCTYCHQGPREVAARGDKLTAHHLLNEDGTRVTPPRYTTACGHCNSSIGGENRR